MWRDREGSREEDGMARCDRCGNDYDKSFEIRMGTETHVFDSFECAIQSVAPICDHCGLRIIGHGVESDGSMFCCANCARASGVSEVHDRV
jgi:phage terminase large subunit GpA-like protein